MENLFKTAGEELASSEVSNGNHPAFRVTVEGPAQTLPPLLQDEIFQIGHEVLRNAFRHANASRIEAEIHTTTVCFVCGFGIMAKGSIAKSWRRVFDQAIGDCLASESGPNGLARRLVFWSEAGAGTEVELEIPSQNRLCEILVPDVGFRLSGKNGEALVSSDLEPIRVIAADDHPLLRKGIASLVNAESDMMLVGEASTGVEAIKQFKQHRPDITLMDLQMPEMNGIDPTIAIRPGISGCANYRPHDVYRRYAGGACAEGRRPRLPLKSKGK